MKRPIRIKALSKVTQGVLLIGLIAIYGCKVNDPTGTLPKVTTTAVSDITAFSATSGGEIISDGNLMIIEKGIVWGTSTPVMLTNGTKSINDTDGLSSFKGFMTDLTTNTQYYVRAYAINSEGLGFGNELSFKTQLQPITDLDGNVYPIVKIGTQTWMAKNLKTKKYNDGTEIPLNDIGTVVTPSVFWYANPKNSNTLEALYNWWATDRVSNGNKNICPSGWHVPSDGEWTIMDNYLMVNGYNYDGSVVGNKYAKSMASSTTNWASSDVVGSVGKLDFPSFQNKAGFSAYPNETRGVNGPLTDLRPKYGMWWTTTTELTFSYPNNAFIRLMAYDSSGLERSFFSKHQAYAIRCVKD